MMKKQLWHVFEYCFIISFHALSSPNVILSFIFPVKLSCYFRMAACIPAVAQNKNFVFSQYNSKFTSDQNLTVAVLVLQ